MERARSLLLIGALCLARAPAAAQPGTLGGGPLLQQTFGPRATALGQSYVSLADDGFALSYNPAGLSRLSQTHAALQYIAAGDDQKYSYASVISPLNQRHAVGLSFANYDGGRAELFDANGENPTVKSVQSDRLLQLGYSYALRDNLPFPGSLYIGGAGRYFTSTLLEQSRAQTTAFDAGLLYQYRLNASSLLNLGFSQVNIGRGITYQGGLASGGATDPLPRTTRLGASWQLATRPNNMWTLSAELDRVREEGSFGGFGFEFVFSGLAALRAGYRVGGERPVLSFGGGLRWQRVQFNYTMQSTEFRQIQQISLEYAFRLRSVSYAKATVPQPPQEVGNPFDEVFERIRRDVLRGHYFAAHQDITRILLWFPDSPEARELQARLEVRVDGSLARGPDDADYYYALFYRRFFEDDWRTAHDAYLRARANGTAKPDGRAYFAQVDERVEDVRRIAKLTRGEQMNELFTLALKAYEAKHYARARRITDKILEMGDYPPARLLQSNITAAIRQRQTVIAFVEAPRPRGVQTEDVDRSNTLYYEAMRQYAEGAFDKALRTLRRAAELNPGNLEVANTFSRLVREQGSERFE